MNALSSPDPRLKIVKENTVLSFNEAGRFPVDFVEFDVQVYPQTSTRSPEFLFLHFALFSAASRRRLARQIPSSCIL